MKAGKRTAQANQKIGSVPGEVQKLASGNFQLHTLHKKLSPYQKKWLQRQLELKKEQGE